MLISEYMGKPGLKPRALEFRLLTVIPMCLSKQLRGDNVKEISFLICKGVTRMSLKEHINIFKNSSCRSSLQMILI